MNKSFCFIRKVLVGYKNNNASLSISQSNILGMLLGGTGLGGPLTHQCVPGISYRGGHCAGFLRPCVWNTTPTPKPAPPPPPSTPTPSLLPPSHSPPPSLRCGSSFPVCGLPLLLGKRWPGLWIPVPGASTYLPHSGSGALMLSIVFIAPGIQKALDKYLLEE